LPAPPACGVATINSVANNIAIGAFSADAADMVLAATTPPTP
jgi:hypothetical protein